MKRLALGNRWSPTISFLSEDHMITIAAVTTYVTQFRINDQWRICFQWPAGKARNVEIVDYPLVI